MSREDARKRDLEKEQIEFWPNKMNRNELRDLHRERWIT